MAGEHAGENDVACLGHGLHEVSEGRILAVGVDELIVERDDAGLVGRDGADEAGKVVARGHFRESVVFAEGLIQGDDDQVFGARRGTQVLPQPEAFVEQPGSLKPDRDEDDRRCDRDQEGQDGQPFFDSLEHIISRVNDGALG